jgi:hypothetical protein
MTALDEIRGLAPPPATPVGNGGEWSIDVPADFRALVAAYGQGEFCDLISLRMPADLGRTDHELLPWGTTSNGDLLCWEPNTWTVALWDQREDTEYEHHPVGATEFLADWLAGRRTSDRLPKAFRELTRWFTPPRNELHVVVRLSASHDQLRLLREALAPTTLRRSSGTQHIFVTGEWRVTHDPNFVRFAYPPADHDRVRDVMRAAATTMGCEIRSATHFDGRPAWD